MIIHDSLPFQWLMVILDRFLWCHLKWTRLFARKLTEREKQSHRYTLCIVSIKCIVSVISLFWEASMLGHGAGIGYTGPGWAPLTIISVWWRDRLSRTWSRRPSMDRRCWLKVSDLESRLAMCTVQIGFLISVNLVLWKKIDTHQPFAMAAVCDSGLL